MPGGLVETPSTSDIIGLMQQVIGEVSPQVEYTDALYTNLHVTNISRDSIEASVSEPFSTKGDVFRMLKRGEWREAAFGDLRDKQQIMEEAKEVAAFSPISTPSTQKIAMTKPWKTSVKITGKRDPRVVELVEKMKIVQNCYEIAKNYDPRIINAISNYREVDDERIFVNSEGSELLEELTRVHLSVVSLAKENDRIEYDYCFAGKTGGFEDADQFFSEQVIKDTSRSAIDYWVRIRFPPELSMLC
jgi:predicted Zn-dependent protease